MDGGVTSLAAELGKTSREHRAFPSGPRVPPGFGRSALSSARPLTEATYVEAPGVGSDMAGTILIVLSVLFLPLAAIAIVCVLGIRSKSSTVRDAPVASTAWWAIHSTCDRRAPPGTYASVIRHRAGRREGTTNARG